MRSKTYKWFIYYPGDTYALGPIEITANNKRAVREWAREWSKVKRLPNGFQCWRA